MKTSKHTEDDRDRLVESTIVSVFDNRRSHLERQIAGQSVATFCGKYDLEIEFISQLRSGQRPFDEKAARYIEISIGLSVFEFDNQAPKEAFVCSNFGDRVKLARIRKGVSQVELAEACGWESQSRISGYETNEREPKREDVLRIAEVCEVEPSWLYFGDGEMASLSGFINSNGEHLSSDEYAFLGLYRSLPRSKRALAKRIVGCIE